MSRTDPSPTNGDTDHKRIAHDRPEIARDANVVGIDADGCVHFHSALSDHVWVVDPDPVAPIASTITHDQDVSECSIWEWIDHCTECRGDWQELRYDRGSLTEALANRLVEATQ